MTQKDVENVFLFSPEEMEELGIEDENDEVDAKAQREAEGLAESNIVAE